MLLSVEELREALRDRKTLVVAKACNIHPQTIREIKNGKKRIFSSETLEKLSRYFGEGK